MIDIQTRLRVTVVTVAFAVYAAIPAIADDIEIYTTANLSATAIQPNVMFIMDTSNSMAAPLSVPVAYDYTHTYVGCYDASMLYFTTGGSLPPCSSKDILLKASNKCDASLNLYDKGVIIDAVGPLEKHGFYADQIAQYHGSKNIWQAISTKNAAQQAYLMECYTDSGVHGDTGPGNPYINDGGPWTATVPPNPTVPHPVWANGDNHLQIYDGNYLNYRVDPSVGSGPVSRMQVAKDAIEAIVTSNNNINIGLMRFDSSIGQGGYEGGAVMYPALDVKASRNDFNSRLKTMTDGGSTTLSETYYEALLYFGGKEIVYGDLAVPSNQTGTKENGNPKFYETPITAECQKNYIIYMTDGSPDRDYLDASKRSALTNFAGGSCNTDPDPGTTTDHIKFNLDASGSGSSTRDNCLDELAGWAKSNDVAERNFSAHDGTQTITTYTVGFDFSSSPNLVDQAGLQLLKDTAKAGGGKFYEAKSKDSLLGVFNQIIADILAVNSTFSSPAVSVNSYNRATNLNDLYFTLFKPSNGAHWDGNLKKYKLGKTLDANGDPVPEIQDAPGNPAVDPNTGFFSDAAISYWTPTADAPDGAETAVGGAASKLSLMRNAYTFTGTYTDINSVAYPSDGDLTSPDNELSSGNTKITDAMLGGVASNPDITYISGGTSFTRSYTEVLLDWAYGYDRLDEDGDFESNEARRIMGDPLHAEPALVQYGEHANGDPKLVAYTATNDGYLHAVDSIDGREYFTFVPQELLPNLNNIFEDTGVAGKSYGLDGNVVPWINDANFDGDLDDSGDHVYLYFGQRRGGSDIFSLDVTDTMGPTPSPKLRWVIKGGTGDFAGMGQTWSTPNVERLRLGGLTRTVLIFGGGYDTGQDTVSVRTPDAVGRSVYIVDADTGELLWRAGPDPGADLQLPDMKYSIPGRIKPIDVDSNGYADQLYFGDMGGQLWRIDIEESETISTLSTLIRGGRIADFALDNSAADTRRFYYPPDVAMIVESGQVPYLSILAASGYRAHPLNQTIHDRMYMLRMDDTFNAPATYATVTEANLFDTTDNAIGEGTAAQKSAAVTNLGNAEGWYITFNELNGSFIGEKALAEPLIIDAIGMVTTYVPEDLNPNAASCIPKAGTGTVFYVNVTDGTPTFNIAGTTDKTREDRKEFLKRGGIPPSPSVIITEGGTPTMCIGTECATFKMYLGLQKMQWNELEQ